MFEPVEREPGQKSRERAGGGQQRQRRERRERQPERQGRPEPAERPDRDDLHLDAEVDGRLIEVKSGVAALRSIRTSLMQLAFALSQRPRKTAWLVLPDVRVTRERLAGEWRRAAAVFRPEIAKRLSLCVEAGERLAGIPRDPDAATARILARVLHGEGKRAGARPVRGDASFVVLKVLLHHWLTDGRPVTAEWLARTCGYSYPTIASVVRGLGSLVERRSDRRLRLRWFSREEFARLQAMSDRARETVRFTDRSGHARTLEAHLRRLEKLAPKDLAIGGVLGARHHDRALDLAGTPRLDLSQHCPHRHLDLRFVRELDPALERVADPLAPATVVVHAVRHADPLFTPRKGGLQWADPVECLLDLHEARLDTLAPQFLEALQRRRKDQA